MERFATDLSLAAWVAASVSPVLQESVVAPKVRSRCGHCLEPGSRGYLRYPDSCLHRIEVSTKWPTLQVVDRRGTICWLRLLHFLH